MVPKNMARSATPAKGPETQTYKDHDETHLGSWQNVFGLDCILNCSNTLMKKL